MAIDRHKRFHFPTPSTTHTQPQPQPTIKVHTIKPKLSKISRVTKMAIDFLKNPNNTIPPPPLILEYSDDEMAQIHANAELTVFIQLFGRKLGSFQLGSYLHGFFKLDGRVEVYEHAHCRYSAKFSSQQDYDRATQRSTWQISDHYFIEIYKFQPNFQFGKVPLFHAGDFVEARLEGLPIEYFVDIAVFKLVNAVCEPLGCQVLRVDSSKGKPPRFWFQLIDSNCCLVLPLHVQIGDGSLVGLSYSRAQQCYHCGGFGHFRKTCPELNQRTRSLNRATPSTSGPSQVHRSHFSRQPVLVSDLSSPTLLPEDTQGGIQDHEPTLRMSSEESSEGTSEITPFSPIEFFARCSGSISPSRPIEEMEMGAKGAMLVENGEESRAKLYNIGEEVCEIDVAVKVTNLNDQRGNQRRVTITPRTGNVPRCSKKLLYTTIEDVEDRNALRALKDTCDEKDVSMAIVFDKSSVLINDDQIVRCFGFSASHSSEMTFRSFGSDGSVRDVKGNCLLMWNREELRVTISPVSYGNTQLLSQHLEFNASWLVVESDSDESSNGFSSSEGESSIDSSQSGDTDSDESLLFTSTEEGISNESSTSSSSSSESSISLPNSATQSRDVKGNCLLMWIGEELRMNVSPVSYGNTQLLSQHLEFNSSWLVVESDSDESPNGFSSSEGESSIDSSQSGNTDSDESLLFTSSVEGISNESSTSSSSSSESSVSLPNSAAHSEESSLFSTDAEEISNGSSAPSTSEESDDSFVLSRNGE